MPPTFGPFLSDEEVIATAPDDQAAIERIRNFHEVGRRRTAKEKKLGPEAREMYDIRTKLGMTQTDFAIALGEPRERIINIENGRVRRVPEKLLRYARAQLEAGKTERVDRLKKLQATPISELLARWWQMLGAMDDKDGAAQLGTTLMTVERWRKDNRHPNPDALLRYDRIAHRELRRREALADEKR